MRRRGVSYGPINFFIYIAFLLLFMVFYFLFNHTSMDVSMTSEIGYADAQAALGIFIQSPVVVYGETMSLADLISRATLNESYRRIVRSEIRKLIAPSPGDPLFGMITRYEMMVEAPAGNPVPASRNAYQDTDGLWKWDGKTHGSSYYVGKFSPYIAADSSSYGRLKVAEVLLPDRKGGLINVSLWKSTASERNKKHAANPGAFMVTDLTEASLYPGEFLEDNGGNIIVFWDIDGRVFVSIDGAPCFTRLSGEDVTCLDGSVPDEDDLLRYEDYLKGEQFPNALSGSSGTSYQDLVDLAVGGTVTFGKDVWMKWGNDAGSHEGMGYFAKEGLTGDLCNHVLLETYRSSYTCPPTPQDPGYGETLIMLERMDAENNKRESVFLSALELKTRYGLT